MTDRLKDILQDFATKNRFGGKGPLSIALVVTQHARTKSLPLDPETLVTQSGTQVVGTGGPAVQNILKRHGIERLLAAEGGRTSRGSVGKMRSYVKLLNDLNSQDLADLDVIESFWIDRVHNFFAGKPFTIKLDTSSSLRHVVSDIIAQAVERQANSPGTYYAGAVLQHLVGAKLDCALGQNKFEHHSFSTADAPSSRVGDFFVGDVAIHVTTSPSEAVVERCRENLNDGVKPILVTTQRGVSAAEILAENRNIHSRIDIFEIEQFVALNIYELGKFAENGRRIAIRELVARYNEIIDQVETDPSLKILIRK